MFAEVIPAIWSEHGLQLRGVVPFGASFSGDYALFVANGMATGTEETAHMHMSGMSGMAASDSPGYMRTLADNVTDNNKDKAVGLRLGLNMFSDKSVGASRVGVSLYTSAIDPAATRRLSILDVDASIRFGDLSLRVEAAQTYLGSDQDPLQPFEQGIYVQASYKIQRFLLTARWDYAASWRPESLDALGNVMEMMEPMTMPGHEGHMMPMGMPGQTIARQAVFCLAYLPSPLWSLRGEVRLPLGGGWFDALESRSPRFSAMVSFYF
jgi:hypothetical protein